MAKIKNWLNPCFLEDSHSDLLIPFNYFISLSLDLRSFIKIINYFHKSWTEWNFHKLFLGSLECCCPSLLAKFKTWNTSGCYKNQHSLLTRKVFQQYAYYMLLWYWSTLYAVDLKTLPPHLLRCCLLYSCLWHCHCCLCTTAPSHHWVYPFLLLQGILHHPHLLSEVDKLCLP